jgi:hypothetical protein
MVHVEVIVIVHVRLDGVQVDIDILELLHDVVATRHALSARNGIAFMRTGSDKLEALLRHLQVLAILCGLTDQRVHDTFDDVLLRSGGIYFAD